MVFLFFGTGSLIIGWIIVMVSMRVSGLLATGSRRQALLLAAAAPISAVAPFAVENATGWPVHDLAIGLSAAAIAACAAGSGYLGFQHARPVAPRTVV